MATERELSKQRITTRVYNSGSKIAYSNSEINKTAALEFDRMIISDKQKPAENLHKGWPGIETETSTLIKVPNSGHIKKMTVQEPITVELASLETNTEDNSSSCSERSVLDGKPDHISELQQRFCEARVRLREQIKEIRYSESSGIDPRPDQILEMQQRLCEVWRLQEKIEDGERSGLDRRRENILQKCEVRMPVDMRRRSMKLTKRKHVSVSNGSFKNKIRKSRTAISERMAHTGLAQRKSIWWTAKVKLSDILKKIVNSLFENKSISHLFQNQATAKEAPDYLDIVKRPMEISTIRSKVNTMVYMNRKEFRHDVLQISFNACQYNDGRNPVIPSLADQLLQLCDQLLEQHKSELKQAEADIVSAHRSDLWSYL